MGKLNNLSVQRLSKPGRHSDGNGLYLQVAPNGSKSWIFRYGIGGRTREMGLGSIDIISLADARNKTLDCRKSLNDGRDPIDQRKSEKHQRLVQTAKAITFDEAADEYIKLHESSWKSKKHAQQWRNTIETYASPRIGHLPVQAIDIGLITQVLSPIWGSKNETASRLRSRLELILAWATVNGYRVGENPALWRNQLDKVLPRRSLVRKITHHRALSYDDIGGLLIKLRGEVGVSPRALEFLILTATRTSETLNAEWSEIDEARALWVIPAERMKGKQEHRVPLSRRAMDILASMRGQDDRFIFPSYRKRKALSNMALLKVLERMGVDVTVHGFRSTFRDWAAERTNFSRDVCEQALAHVLKDKVEAAYRRGDLLLKRTALMAQWGEYCSKVLPENTVVLITPDVQVSLC